MAHRARPVDRGHQRKLEKRPVAGHCPNGGKLAFSSKAKARKELRRYAASATGSAKAVYQCPHCGLWHLTSSPQRRAA